MIKTLKREEVYANEYRDLAKAQASGHPGPGGEMFISSLFRYRCVMTTQGLLCRPGSVDD